MRLFAQSTRAQVLSLPERDTLPRHGQQVARGVEVRITVFPPSLPSPICTHLSPMPEIRELPPLHFRCLHLALRSHQVCYGTDQNADHRLGGADHKGLTE